VLRLSSETGLHENTVRSHLEALDRAGVVTRQLAPTRARGRPAWLYAASPERDPSEMSGFTHALVGALRHESTSPKRAAVTAGRAWGAVVGAERRPADPAAASRPTWLLEMLDGLGFAPEASDGPLIRLTRCPLLEVARADPDVVCSVHLGMIRGALRAAGLSDSGVRLTPFDEPGCCRLELDEGAPPSPRR
jgi:predicted ArsR family transcriptional regulator